MSQALQRFYAVFGPKACRPARVKAAAQWDLDVSQGEWRALRTATFARDNFTCVYCGARPAILHADHRIPRSRGGPSTLPNLATACPQCNLEKGAKTVQEWLQ